LWLPQSFTEPEKIANKRSQSKFLRIAKEPWLSSVEKGKTMNPIRSASNAIGEGIDLVVKAIVLILVIFVFAIVIGALLHLY
jgi:hypothetical protein